MHERRGGGFGACCRRGCRARRLRRAGALLAHIGLTRRAQIAFAVAQTPSSQGRPLALLVRNRRFNLLPRSARLAPAEVRLAPANVRLAPATARLAPAGLRLAPATFRRASATSRRASANFRLTKSAIRQSPATGRHESTTRHSAPAKLGRTSATGPVYPASPQRVTKPKSFAKSGPAPASPPHHALRGRDSQDRAPHPRCACGCGRTNRNSRDGQLLQRSIARWRRRRSNGFPRRQHPPSPLHMAPAAPGPRA